MINNSDYLSFKSMLECFLFRLQSAHLQQVSGGQFTHGFNSQIAGYSKYQNYWTGKGGHGHAKGKSNSFQAQTQQWSLNGTLSMAIKQSHSVKDYTDRANYLYWLGSSSSILLPGEPISTNIAANWDKGKNSIVGIDLYYSWKGAVKQFDTISFNLKELGLYDYSSITPSLMICFEIFSEMKNNVVLDKAYWDKVYSQKQMLFTCYNLVKNNYNLILSGAPGTGKTFLAREIAASLIGLTDSKQLNNHEQFSFVQFHPSYDYTDFVEGLRPKDDGKGNIVFERKDGVFKAFCARAAISENSQDPIEKEKKYVFVIDEINRGEISKVFGELFFSIDPGYRTIADRIPVKTQYQNLILKNEMLKDDYGNVINDNQGNGIKYPFVDGFYVPSNVYIIGTMNDIDRSVESMDFAFRRRFAFHEISAQDSEIIIRSAEVSKGWNDKIKQEAIERMTRLNEALFNPPCGLTEQYNIGGAYFLKLENVDFDFDKLWSQYLKGTLYEYFRGLPSKEIKEKMGVLDNAYKMQP